MSLFSVVLASVFLLNGTTAIDESDVEFAASGQINYSETISGDDEFNKEDGSLTQEMSKISLKCTTAINHNTRIELVSKSDMNPLVFTYPGEYQTLYIFPLPSSFGEYRCNSSAGLSTHVFNITFRMCKDESECLASKCLTGHCLVQADNKPRCFEKKEPTVDVPADTFFCPLDSRRGHSLDRLRKELPNQEIYSAYRGFNSSTDCSTVQHPRFVYGGKVLAYQEHILVNKENRTIHLDHCPQNSVGTVSVRLTLPNIGATYRKRAYDLSRGDSCITMKQKGIELPYEILVSSIAKYQLVYSITDIFGNIGTIDVVAHVVPQIAKAVVEYENSKTDTIVCNCRDWSKHLTIAAVEWRDGNDILDPQFTDRARDVTKPGKYKCVLKIQYKTCSPYITILTDRIQSAVFNIEHLRIPVADRQKQLPSNTDQMNPADTVRANIFVISSFFALCCNNFRQ